jgi:osmoprotectant transport system substrate-binding protein
VAETRAGRSGRAAARGLAATLLALALGAAACGGTPGATASPTGPAQGRLTIADAAFTESKILADMYARLLTRAGYRVERTSVASTEIAESSLESGQIDVMPQYVATYADLLNSLANGSDAPSVSSSDLPTSLAVLRRLAAGKGLTALNPANAVDQNAFAVAKNFASAHRLSTLSDLGASGIPVVVAAPAECPTRPFCAPGLAKVYGITVAGLIQTGFDTFETKAAVRDGSAQLGLVASTDASINDFGLVLLTDDKKLQNADNLVPIVNTRSLAPAIKAALNALAPVLTTSDLASLNRQVDVDHRQPADVAAAYLRAKHLLST